MTIEALILTEHNRLVELERTIEAGLKTFVDVGNALLEIRDGKLYRGTDGTFEEYCGNRWSFTSVQAKRLIDGAIIATNIEPTGSKIVSESHLRPLKNLRPDEQREVYQRAVETAPMLSVSPQSQQRGRYQPSEGVKGRNGRRKRRLRPASGNGRWYREGRSDEQ